MLLPINDNIVDAQAIDLPSCMRAQTTYLAMAYDTGTETNSQECALIRGRPVAVKPFPIRTWEKAIFFPSAGIYGEADLSQAIYDWQGAVAIVKIKRVYIPMLQQIIDQ